LALSSLDDDFSDFEFLSTPTWFGDIEVSNNNGKAWLASKRSPKLKGELFPYKGNTLIVRWTDRSMDADALGGRCGGVYVVYAN
jgi:hypothetical protein